MPEIERIAVIGLGYVGLPLAVALARHYPITGYDRDSARITQLQAGRDRTGEFAARNLRRTKVRFTADAADLAGADVYIISVPTPVNRRKKPDLAAVRAACATVGDAMDRNAIVVLESTVYPGVTEEVCGPALEVASGLVCGRDFFLGYSPERINPGDRQHAIERITKVVAGQTPAVTEKLATIYGAVTGAGIFVARDIRTAEAAKVIENAQRDLNIAFINELTMIFAKAGISIHDVLEAAATKWNFLPFQPGMVGGHCIGVDPFYLADFARTLGHRSEIVLAGRRINDAMGTWLAEEVARGLDPDDYASPDGVGRVLVLGLSFKENVPDLRNSKVPDLIAGLEVHDLAVDVHDPNADPKEALHLCGVELMVTLDGQGGYDAVIGAVPHDPYRGFTAESFTDLLAPGGLLVDIKGIWRHVELPAGLRRWQP